MKIDRDRYENERTHTKVETQSFHRAGEKIKSSLEVVVATPRILRKRVRNRETVIG